MLWLKMMMIEVKAASLTTIVSLKHLQLNHKVNLNHYNSLDYLRWTVRSVLQLQPLICQKKHKQTKTKRRRSDQRQKYGNVGVQSLYHGIFTTFQRHNAYSYNYGKKELIISLLTNCKLVRTPPTVSKNAEVSSWWRGSSTSNSSSLHSMML